MTKPVKILVKRMGAIGDVLMCTPVIMELHMAHTLPNKDGSGIEDVSPEITVITDHMEIFLNNPHVTNVLPSSEYLDADALKAYDIYINLDDAYEYANFPNYSTALYYRAFGCVPDRNYDPIPILNYSEIDSEFVDSILEENDVSDQYIVVHMRNWHWGAKNISMNVWNSVFEKLYDSRIDFNVICVGGGTDFSLDAPPLVYDMRGKFTPHQLKYLIEKSICFVGPDSLPYHCAVGTGKAIGLFTHIDENTLYGYPSVFGVDRYAVETKATCRNCYFRQETPVRQIKCDTNDFRCTEEFDTDAIAKLVLTMFSQENEVL